MVGWKGGGQGEVGHLLAARGLLYVCLSDGFGILVTLDMSLGTRDSRSSCSNV